MNIKLIALDLDGTLLNSKKQLSEGNRIAISSCIQKGILIVPCTGRTVLGIPEVVKRIPGVRYAITTNGAVIEDMEENKLIDSRLLSNELAMELLRLIDSYPVMYDPYIDRRGVSEPRFFEHLSEYGLRPEIQTLIRQTRDVYPNIIEFVEKSQKSVEKINLFFRDMEERYRLRAVLEKREDILVTSSMELNLEINAVGATKGNGILRLASHLGLKKEETMAVGDGENDFSMIQEAGLGVAMKNGKKELLDMADYITDTNDEDGVAVAINRFALGKE